MLKIFHRKMWFRFYTYFVVFCFVSLFEPITEIYVFHNRSFSNYFGIFSIFLLCFILGLVWVSFFHKLSKEVETDIYQNKSINLGLKIEIFVAAVLIIVLNSSIFSNDGYKESKKPFGIWDPSTHLSLAKGLLLPTKEMIPLNYVGDDRGYGFGSNDGCFGPQFILRGLEGAEYCFRFFDSKAAVNFDGTQGNYRNYSFDNAETLVFRADSYPDEGQIDTTKYGKRNMTNFSVDVFISNKINNDGIDYIKQDFEYAGIPGTILSYSERGDFNILRLFWSDPTRLNIEWSTPTPKTRSFEEILNLLPSMRRSDGVRLLEAPENLVQPQLIGKPIEIRHASESIK